ncbi:hypothetical protein CAG99_16210 [Streptomyces marincola]|uniref:Restriction endonuclease n=2 Tax=Streptomyces marincola TaxID=2878388 RepID=A0A1W7CZM1_9ACTN|nr:hypothetical protein CAG99_16210 [Streptomyces marincola]
MVVDLFDVTGNRLIECKRSVTRQSIHAAVAQLLDHRRFLAPTPLLVVLVPGRPRDDLVNLCSSLMIEVVWPDEEGGFMSSFD